MLAKLEWVLSWQLLAVCWSVNCCHRCCNRFADRNEFWCAIWSISLSVVYLDQERTSFYQCDGVSTDNAVWDVKPRGKSDATTVSHTKYFSPSERRFTLSMCIWSVNTPTPTGHTVHDNNHMSYSDNVLHVHFMMVMKSTIHSLFQRCLNIINLLK